MNRQRIHGYLTRKLWDLEEAMCEIESDRITDPLFAATAWLQKALCFVLGHMPTADQCNIPDHDFCAWCNKSTPGQAEGRVPA